MTTPTVQEPILSERELQVLDGISYGKTNGQIGLTLHLSEDTIKSHARTLFKKLGVTDRSHAVRVGLERRILTANGSLRQAPQASPNPLAVPGYPVPPSGVRPPTSRGYSDRHIAACIVAEQCPCRREPRPHPNHVRRELADRHTSTCALLTPPVCNCEARKAGVA